MHDDTTLIGVEYDSIDQARAAHETDDAVAGVAVTIHAPIYLVGVPARDGRPFLEPLTDAERCGPHPGDRVWATTGRTVVSDVCGLPVPLIEYVDLESLHAAERWTCSSGPEDLLDHVKRDGVAGMVALWLDEYGDPTTRRVMIDVEGMIRRTVGFKLGDDTDDDAAIEYRRANGGLAGTLSNGEPDEPFMETPVRDTPTIEGGHAWAAKFALGGMCTGAWDEHLGGGIMANVYQIDCGYTGGRLPVIVVTDDVACVYHSNVRFEAGDDPVASYPDPEVSR